LKNNASMDITLNHKYFIDLHVHTNRYSPCAEGLKPELIPGLMKEKNLHGVIITEHDTMWNDADIDQLNNGMKDRRIYNGMEVSSANSHFVVIGMDTGDGFFHGMPVDQILELAGKCKAAVILAHHHRMQGKGPPVDILTMPDEINAIEVASTITYGKNEADARMYARMKKWHTVAGSDAHHIDNIGAAFTAFEIMPANEKELADAIRNGAGIPMRSGATQKEFRQYAT